MPLMDTIFYGLSQVICYVTPVYNQHFSKFTIQQNGVTIKRFHYMGSDYSQTWDNPYPRWTPNSMGYHRLWVITGL